MKAIKNPLARQPIKSAIARPNGGLNSHNQPGTVKSAAIRNPFTRQPKGR